MLMKKNHHVTEIIMSNQKFVEEYLDIYPEPEYDEDYFKIDPEEKDDISVEEDGKKGTTLEDFYGDIKKDLESSERLRPLTIIYGNLEIVSKITGLKDTSELTKKLLLITGQLERIPLYTSSEWKGIESLLFSKSNSATLLKSFENLLESKIIYAEIEMDETGDPKEGDINEHSHRSYWRCPNNSAIRYAKLFLYLDSLPRNTRLLLRNNNFKRPPNDEIYDTQIRVMVCFNKQYVSNLVDQIQKEKNSIVTEYDALSGKEYYSKKQNYIKASVFLPEQNIDLVERYKSRKVPGRKKYPVPIQVYLTENMYLDLIDLGGDISQHVRSALENYLSEHLHPKEILEKKLFLLSQEADTIRGQLGRIEKREIQEIQETIQKDIEKENNFKYLDDRMENRLKHSKLQEIIKNQIFINDAAEYMGITPEELIKIIRQRYSNK